MALTCFDSYIRVEDRDRQQQPITHCPSLSSSVLLLTVRMRTCSSRCHSLACTYLWSRGGGGGGGGLNLSLSLLTASGVLFCQCTHKCTQANMCAHFAGHIHKRTWHSHKHSHTCGGFGYVHTTPHPSSHTHTHTPPPPPPPAPPPLHTTHHHHTPPPPVRLTEIKTGNLIWKMSVVCNAHL